LVNRLLGGETFAHGPERLLQKILAECAVKPSAKLNLLRDTQKLTLAGDGAPLETGANPFGKKICQCKQQGIFRCSCPRYYTDPNQASAHDSITFVQAYAQLRSLFPSFEFERALLDSAHDAYAIYRLLNLDKIEPVY
jgi:hypothetical protein